ncbi:hypothetical protein EDC04DRAFT_2895228 [Pisolithus marmoratus]|nr:hypothetical protein EDC04DRAFT_2895228 [Pisolithus marmoratus]
MPLEDDFEYSCDEAEENAAASLQTHNKSPEIQTIDVLDHHQQKNGYPHAPDPATLTALGLVWTLDQINLKFKIQNFDCHMTWGDDKSQSKETPAKWSEDEEQALVIFLQEQAPAASNGVNFSKKHFDNAAQHLQEKFLNQHGGEKTGTACSSKWMTLKEEYFVVIDLQSTSGLMWSDEHGAGMSSHDPVWKDYLKSHRCAAQFRNKGFHLFSLMAEMMPSHSKGMHIFHPGGTHSKPKSGVPTNIPSVMSLAGATSSSLVLPSFVPSALVSTHSQASPTVQDVAALPSTPSSFLIPSDLGSGSSVLTSASHRKCKSSALSGPTSAGSSVVSEESQKCIHGPSATVAAQVEHMGALNNISSMLDNMSKVFASLGITSSSNVYKEAMAVLDRHKANVSMDDFIDLGQFLTSPKNKHHAILFSGMKEPSYQKHWLERTLEDIRKNRGA